MARGMSSEPIAADYRIAPDTAVFRRDLRPLIRTSEAEISAPIRSRKAPGRADSGRADGRRTCWRSRLARHDKMSGHNGPSGRPAPRSEEHTSELQSLMRIAYAVFCLKKKETQIYKIKSRIHKAYHV